MITDGGCILFIATLTLANVDIKKKQQQEAPTPQNTPHFSALHSSAPTTDNMDTIQTPGKEVTRRVTIYVYFFGWQQR